MHYFHRGSMPEWIWLILMVGVGAVAAGIAGYIVGLPSLRLRGDYLAVVTLGFGEIIRIIVQNQEALGGSYGLSIHAAGELGVLKITPLWMIGLLLIVCIAVCRNLLKTAHGLPFLAVREDELAASAMGVNTTKTKVTAFIVGAAFAGMAGALFAHYEGFITIKQFDMNQSFLILAMVVIGGTGSITGAAVAGFVLSLLPESLRDLPKVPAFALFGFIFASILVIVLSRKVRPRIAIDRPSGTQNLFAALGVAGVLLALYFALWVWWPVWPALTKKLPTMSNVCLAFIALGLAGAMLLTKKRAQNLASFGWVVAIFGAILLLTIPISRMFGSIPFLANLLSGTEYEAGKLRFPVFAVSLVVVMLSRPQGLFGHHEFSWSWVKGILGRPHPTTEVAA
jgi:branched-chain amino acid transport system permease protein